MQKLELYKGLNLKTEDEVFDYMLDKLKETIASYKYYTDFEKVLKNVKHIEIELNMLDYLIGKENVEEELYKLISKYPQVVSAFPILIAVRSKEIKVTIKNNNIVEILVYNFKKKKEYSENEKKEIIHFLSECGLLELFKSKQIKSVLDYVIGIEVGLDTNARKNRTGKIMENITEYFIKNLCEKYGYRYIAQANSIKIEKEFGKKIIVDKSDRQFDFAILSQDKLYVIETNFFNSNGSKLKSVCGEFKSVNIFMKEKNIGVEYLWITDGLGWRASKKPLREAYESIDHILTIQMIEDGILEQIIKQR